jgi:hypothetical protein
MRARHRLNESALSRIGNRLHVVRTRLRPTSGTASGLLSAGTTIISVIVAYLYFAGWVYSYYFYEDFGVYLVSFDVPFQYFPVYAFTVMTSVSGAVLTLALLSALYLFVRNRLSGLTLMALLIVAFPLSFLTAQNIGHSEATSERIRRKPIVHFSFKNPELAKYSIKLSERPVSILDLDTEEKLDLLLETKDRVVVFYQPDSIGPVLPAVYVYSVMKSDLQWSMVINGERK